MAEVTLDHTTGRAIPAAHPAPVLLGCGPDDAITADFLGQVRGRQVTGEGGGRGVHKEILSCGFGASPGTAQGPEMCWLWPTGPPGLPHQIKIGLSCLPVLGPEHVCLKHA